MNNLKILALEDKCNKQYETIVKLNDEKIDLFKENQQLKEIISKATEHLELKQIRYLNEAEYRICTIDLQEIKDILKGENK